MRLGWWRQFGQFRAATLKETIDAMNSTKRRTSADSNEGFAVTLELQSGYRFDATCDLPSAQTLVVDEAPPLGSGSFFTPSRLLAAAVASCLGSSLLFCLRKARVEVRGLQVRVRGSTRRNERGRLRVAALQVDLQPDIAEADRDRVPRCLDIFQDFCVVTESVRQGIDISVNVVLADTGARAAPASEPAPS
jgi:uncharacterized OsmC-like protein